MGADRVGVLWFPSPLPRPYPAPAALLHRWVCMRSGGASTAAGRATTAVVRTSRLLKVVTLRTLREGGFKTPFPPPRPHPPKRCVAYEALVLMVRWRSLALESGTEEDFMDDLQSVVRAAVENFLGLVHAAMDAVEQILEDLGRTLTCAPG